MRSKVTVNHTYPAIQLCETAINTNCEMTSSENHQSVVEFLDTKVAQDKLKTSPIASWWAAQWRALLAELVATTLLVLLGCMSCIPVPGLTEQSPLYSPLGFGFIISALVQIFGHISGAHMNSVVTVIAVLWGDMSVPTGIAYFISHAIGATAGYGILTTLTPVNLAEGAVCVTLPHTGLSDIQACGVEVAITAVLGFLCCSVWDPRNKDKQDSVPLKFGLLIAAVSIVAGPLTGASMNPTRSFAPSLWTGIWRAHWVYWVGPFAGGIIAVLLYKLLFIERSQKQE